MTIRILIADDQPVVRDGLAMLLGLIDDVEIVATAADGVEAVERARSERPDIVLMDLRMPRLEGAEATREILASLPDTRVLVLTTYADDEFLFPALQAGARGYLTKDATAEEIEHAIRALIAGQTHLDPAVQQRLVTAVLDQAPRSPPTDPAPASRPDLPDELTPREVEVLQLIASPGCRTPRSQTSWFSAARPSRPISTGSSTRRAPATAPKPCATHTNTVWPSTMPRSARRAQTCFYHPASISTQPAKLPQSAGTRSSRCIRTRLPVRPRRKRQLSEVA